LGYLALGELDEELSVAARDRGVAVEGYVWVGGGRGLDTADLVRAVAEETLCLVACLSVD